MALFKQLGDLCWLMKNYKCMGTCKHVKRTEAAERNNRVNSVFCGTACWGTKYKEKHWQLTSKAIDINFTPDVLFEDFVMVTSTVLIVRWGFIHSDSMQTTLQTRRTLFIHPKLGKGLKRTGSGNPVVTNH